MSVLFLLPILPACSLLWEAGASVATAGIGEAAFWSALANSVLVALGTATISLVFGLPLGAVSALYTFPARRVLMALVSLPLLVPSFLLAIGWSSVAVYVGWAGMISGFAGCMLVSSLVMMPLVLLTSFAASRTLSVSQVDAARLAGGEWRVFLLACRHVGPPALLAAVLGTVVTLSDPGPGQILGLRTAAAEILTSFSVRYDFAHAGMQCVVLAVVVLGLAGPLAYVATPRLAAELLARQTRRPRTMRHPRATALVISALSVVVVAGTIAPTAGLVLPLVQPGAASEIGPLYGGERLALDSSYALWLSRETAANTLIYAVGAGTLATALGLLIALLVGRSERLLRLTLGISLVLFSLPPALTGLGIVQLVTSAPAWTDVILRSRLTVCGALGVRFLPIAVLLSLRAWGSTSPSWAWAAGLQGVSLGTYLRRVVGPFLAPTAALTALIVALLATADVTTVLLLSPPGEASLPQKIFTVMANAPQVLVAGLCLTYLVTAALIVTALWVFTGRDAT